MVVSPFHRAPEFSSFGIPIPISFLTSTLSSHSFPHQKSVERWRQIDLLSLLEASHHLTTLKTCCVLQRLAMASSPVEHERPTDVRDHDDPEGWASSDGLLADHDPTDPHGAIPSDALKSAVQHRRRWLLYLAVPSTLLWYVTLLTWLSTGRLLPRLLAKSHPACSPSTSICYFSRPTTAKESVSHSRWVGSGPVHSAACLNTSPAYRLPPSSVRPPPTK